MAVFTIRSADVVVSGTTNDDLVVFRSGAFAATVQGNAGDDVFGLSAWNSVSGGAIYGNGILNGNAGNDRVNLDMEAGVLRDSFFGGGQDKDAFRLDFSASDVYQNTIQGGEGNDTIFVSAYLEVTGTYSNNLFAGNAGNDRIELDINGTGFGTSLSDFNGNSIRGGEGIDSILIDIYSASVDGLEVVGGQGVDFINISHYFNTGEYEGIATNVIINGGTLDTLDSLDGGDNIWVSSRLIDSTIAGNAGDDSIRYYGNSGSGILVAGNSGDDTITFLSGEDNSYVTIRGGDGSDFISISETAISAFTGADNFIYGGKGDDTIFSTGAQNFDGEDKVTFVGGAGADLFADQNGFSSQATTSNTANEWDSWRDSTFAYESLEDSTYGASDTIIVGSAMTGHYELIMPSNVNVFDGQLGGTDLYFTGGILAWSAASTSSQPLSLGDIVTLLDSNLEAGDAVAFSLISARTGDAGYVFVKGSEDADLLVTFDKIGDGNSFSSGDARLRKIGADRLDLDLYD